MREREEEAGSPCAPSHPVLPAWKRQPPRAIGRAFLDRFMEPFAPRPLGPDHETRSTFMDPVGARECEASPACCARHAARQRVAAWPAQTSVAKSGARLPDVEPRRS